MRTIEKGFVALMWIFAALSGLFTAGAIVSVHINETTDVYDPTLLTIGAVLMLAAAIAYTAMPRGKVIPVAASLVAAVLLVLAIVQLAEAFPPMLGAGGEDVGMTPWRLVYRHYSMLVVPVCMCGAFLSYRSRRREEKAQADGGYKSIYDLSGDAVFHDDSNDATKPKQKRSVATRERKAQQK